MKYIFHHDAESRRNEQELKRKTMAHRNLDDIDPICSFVMPNFEAGHYRDVYTRQGSYRVNGRDQVCPDTYGGDFHKLVECENLGS